MLRVTTCEQYDVEVGLESSFVEESWPWPRTGIQRSPKRSGRLNHRLRATRITLKRFMRSAQRAEGKANVYRGSLGRAWDEITTFFRLLHAYADGRYRDVPWTVFAAIIAAVIYLVSPIDFIPDFIPVIGLTDDALVILAVAASVHVHLDRFRKWESEQKA